MNQIERLLAEEETRAEDSRLRHRIRVHLANRHQYSHSDFCEKLEEILYEDAPAPQPQPKQAPVAWMMVNPTHLPHSRSLHWEPQQWHITWEAVPLYTAPQPQREWARLTDEEIREIESRMLDMGTVFDLMRLIESKLRAKNGGGV